ncbi:MAG: hypothetical protein HQL54_04530 [Magnetococcales bacterium]|nr:hypothetical protein [Magnetococcales bacterium]
MEDNHEIMEKLGKLAGTTEAILSLLNTQTQRMNSHAERLSSLERRQSWFLGIGSVLGALTAWVIRQVSLAVPPGIS